MVTHDRMDHAQYDRVFKTGSFTYFIGLKSPLGDRAPTVLLLHPGVHGQVRAYHYDAPSR